MTFDELEFKILLTAHPDGFGYYPSEPYKTRILELMEEGIIEHNAYTNWIINGYKLTESGIKYYDEFLQKVRANHKHIWMTKKEHYPDLYDDDDEDGNSIDIFAYASGYCNGPKCKKCGFTFCEHCTTEFSIKKCSQ